MLLCVDDIYWPVVTYGKFAETIAVDSGYVRGAVVRVEGVVGKPPRSIKRFGDHSQTLRATSVEIVHTVDQILEDAELVVEIWWGDKFVDASHVPRLLAKKIV